MLKALEHERGASRANTIQCSCCIAGVLFEQGKLDGAIARYREALAHEPNFPEAYNNLGNALREAGRVDEAIQCYTLCIQLQLGRRDLPLFFCPTELISRMMF